eukprot:364302-Chlamydomonas_euryale.AAC.3
MHFYHPFRQSEKAGVPLADSVWWGWRALTAACLSLSPTLWGPQSPACCRVLLPAAPPPPITPRRHGALERGARDRHHRPTCTLRLTTATLHNTHIHTCPVQVVHVTGTTKRPVPLEHALFYGGEMYTIGAHEEFLPLGHRQATLAWKAKNQARTGSMRGAKVWNRCGAASIYLAHAGCDTHRGAMCRFVL